MPEPRRTPSGYRDYGEEEIERLRFIKRAQNLDFTLDEIREILRFSEQGQRPCDYVLGLIEQRAEELDERIRQMVQLREELAELKRLAESTPAPAPQRYCRLIQHQHRV